MTVVFRSGNERSITRCKLCPKEDTRPCLALRVLALPYAQHPLYRPEWRIVQPDLAVAPGRQGSLAVGSEGLLPPPYPRIDDLPPPGEARRRSLRQFGIQISRSDFTDEELRLRGIATDPQPGPSHG